MSFSDDLKSSPPDVSSAVSKFTSTIAEAAQADRLEESLWTSWKELLKTVALTSHDSQSHLVDFLKALRGAENPKKANGALYDIWESSFKWDDLPLFGAETREQWNEYPEPNYAQKVKDSWINRNAFLAQITAQSSPNDPLDYSLYGLWALRPAFEDVNLDSDLPPNFELEAAAIWLLYAGMELKKRSEVGQDFDGKMGAEGGALTGKGWKGLNKERWEFWLKSLDLVKEKVSDESTKELSERVLEGLAKF